MSLTGIGMFKQEMLRGMYMVSCTKFLSAVRAEPTWNTRILPAPWCCLEFVGADFASLPYGDAA